MPGTVLYPIYLVVMLGAALCFTRAFLARKATARHMRWALTGLVLDLFGTLVVLVLKWGPGWYVVAALPTVVHVHRLLALGVTALLLATALAGWRRWRVHPRLGTLFLPLYWTTLGLAIVGYWPYG